jgi:aspartokinase-like uncharacterized kinase
MKKELNIFNFEVKLKSTDKEAIDSTSESNIIPIINKNDIKFNNESIDEFSPFDLNQTVKVITPNKNSNVSEDYYYIIDFAEKKGTITKINSGQNLSYTVMFDNGREGIFYHNDLISIIDS